MIAFAKWVHVVALAVWLGSIVFLSFVIAPTLSSAFPPEQRAEFGRIMGLIFPKYYLVGYLCGVLLLLSSIVLWRTASGGGRWAAAGLLSAVMLAAALYAGIVVQPRAHTLRPQIASSAAAKSEFDHLHKLAVQLNAGVLVGALVVAAVTASAVRP